MSNPVVRKIVENIMNDKFDTLKEDLSKAVSAKAVTILESKKAMVGKNFFGKKKKMNEEMSPSNLSTRTKKSLVSALRDHQKNGYDELSPHLENAWKGRKAEAGSHPAFDNLHHEVQNHLVKAYHTFAKDAEDADGIDDFDHEGIANHLDSAVEAHNNNMPKK